MSDKKDFTEDEEDWISKTRMKKHMNDLQAMGEELQSLSDNQLKQFDLSEKLQAAIAEGKRLKKREALRRHRQFLGRVMREEEEESIAAIQRKLDELKTAHKTQTRAFKVLENLRESLIHGGNEEIGELIAKFPQLDKQKLRQLIKQAKKESEQNLPPSASRKLFRFLRELHETQ